jgi:hypothetical protein
MLTAPAWKNVPLGRWKMVKCINAIDINVPNDCVGFLNCQLPQYYEEKYLK